MSIERFEDIEAMCMIMPEAPALPFEVSSSTCWLTSKVNRSTWRLSTGEKGNPER